MKAKRAAYTELRSIQTESQQLSDELTSDSSCGDELSDLERVRVAIKVRILMLRARAALDQLELPASRTNDP